MVGDPELVRVHIHTAEPAPLIALRVVARPAQQAQGRGHVGAAPRRARPGRRRRAGGCGPADKRRQAATDAPRKAIGVVSVAPGRGFRDILASLGADAVVEGGQTMNPSIEDLLNAVRAANAEKVVLLPNNGNVILTAEQVDGLIDDCEVKVVPTRNLPQGISALLALEPDADHRRQLRADDCRHRARARARGHSRGARQHRQRARDQRGRRPRRSSTTRSARSARMSPRSSRRCSARSSRGPSWSPCTAAGTSPPTTPTPSSRRCARRFPDTEFELHDGGQEHYSYVLSLE